MAGFVEATEAIPLNRTEFGVGVGPLAKGDRSGMRWSTLTLIWMIAVAAWLAWAPLEFHSTEEFDFQLIFVADTETIAHCFFLIPYAITLSVTERARERRFLGVALQVSILATILEAGQWWIKERGVSPYDLLLGIAGPLVALLVFEKWFRKKVADRHVLVGLASVTCVIIFAGILQTVFKLGSGLDLTGWQADHEVVIGDEAGGGRPYEGIVVNASICAGEEANLACINQESSAEEKREFVALVEDSQSVSLGATVRSDTELQKGPARIVTFSNGPLERNVTLGQEGRDLVFRIRTPRSGLNGIDMEFLLADAVSPGIETNVSAAFHKGNIFICAETSESTRCGSYRSQLLYSSLATRGHREARTSLVFMNRAGGVAVFLLFSGLILIAGHFAKPLVPTSHNPDGRFLPERLFLGE